MSRGDYSARGWSKTRALIQSAKKDVLAFELGREIGGVTSIDPSHAKTYSWVLRADGVVQILPHASYAEALDLLRTAAPGELVASAVFDKASARWPNPVTWHKSDDPAHEIVIASQIARHARPTVGALPPGAPPLDPAFADSRGGFWLRARQIALPFLSIGAAVWIGSKIVRAAEKRGWG